MVTPPAETWESADSVGAVSQVAERQPLNGKSICVFSDPFARLQLSA